jgi:hypothetical protein
MLAFPFSFSSLPFLAFSHPFYHASFFRFRALTYFLKIRFGFLVVFLLFQFPSVLQYAVTLYLQSSVSFNLLRLPECWEHLVRDGGCLGTHCGP